MSRDVGSWDNKMAGRIGDVMLPAIMVEGNYGCWCLRPVPMKPTWLKSAMLWRMIQSM